MELLKGADIIGSGYYTKTIKCNHDSFLDYVNKNCDCYPMELEIRKNTNTGKENNKMQITIEGPKFKVGQEVSFFYSGRQLFGKIAGFRANIKTNTNAYGGINTQNTGWYYDINVNGMNYAGYEEKNITLCDQQTKWAKELADKGIKIDTDKFRITQVSYTNDPSIMPFGYYATPKIQEIIVKVEKK